MNGWVKTQAVLDHSKSLAIGWYIHDYNPNGSVPCTVQLSQKRALKEGYVFVKISNSFGAKFQIQVPINEVWIEHKWFTHSIPLHAWPTAKHLMDLVKT